MSRQRKNLSLYEVLYRSLNFDEGLVEPLYKYLEMEKPHGDKKEKAKEITNRLRKMGSNDIATWFRDGKGVPYKEVAKDVAVSLKVEGLNTGSTTKDIEEAILYKVFEDALEHLSEEEQRELFQSMDIDAGDFFYAAAGLPIMQLVGKMGGFSTYKIAVVTANWISRALFNKGLAFGTNVALTRGLGVVLGPIGWIASGAWLTVSLAGPAMRATVPAVIHIAHLREVVENKITIGVIGEGSTGKDSLLKAVFGIDTGKISPIAGSTSEPQTYKFGDTGAIQLVNYPGFNDVNQTTNSETQEKQALTDIFIQVVDLNRGGSGLDTDTYKKNKDKYEVLVCANKTDLVREENKDFQLDDLREKLSMIDNNNFIQTSFDPDPRLEDSPIGVEQVQTWIYETLEAEGKDTDALRKEIENNLKKQPA